MLSTHLRLCLPSGDIIEHFDPPKICDRWRFKISDVSCEFPQISSGVLFEITTVRLGYHGIYATIAPEMFTAVHKKGENNFDFGRFSGRNQKECDEFLDHIVRISGVEI
jgi:hypothetical protein